MFQFHHWVTHSFCLSVLPCRHTVASLATISSMYNEEDEEESEEEEEKIKGKNRMKKY